MPISKEVTMKKILLIALALVLALCVVSCKADKQDEQKELEETEAALANQNVVEAESGSGSFEYELNEEGKCEIVKYTPSSVKVVDLELPKTLDNRDVVGIAEDAFKADNTIKSVKIPEGYTYIDKNAFYDCDILTTVTVEGATLTRIGANAFDGCDALESIVLPASLKTVEAFAFKDCAALVSVDLSGATTIGEGAFLRCAALKSATVSSDITKISKTSFVGCDALEYTVEDGACYLGNADNKYVALVTAQNLDILSVKINDATTVIADQAFLNCDYLETITLGKSITVISASCFEGCEALEYNESENGYYLGTEANPTMVLMGIIDLSKEDFSLSVDTKIICNNAFDNYVALQDILFAGTKEEWNAIEKTSDWNNGRTVRVVFADETIEPIIYN